MRKHAAYLVLFFIVVIFVLYSKKTSITASPTQTSITPTKTQVLAVITENQGQCHAIIKDPSDPESAEPDHTCTPGAINPAVTQDTIAATICRSGYTKTIRPPVSYTEPLKIQSIKAYGYADSIVRNYEEDHLISLELGGSPTDPKNLWPEPGASPNEKDSVENYLHKQVCNGSMSLQEAQKEISTDWYNVYLQIKN